MTPPHTAVCSSQCPATQICVQNEVCGCPQGEVMINDTCYGAVRERVGVGAAAVIGVTYRYRERRLSDDQQLQRTRRVSGAELV